MKDNSTIGMDLGDKYHISVAFDAEGIELEVGKVINTKAGVSNYFRRHKGSTVAIEVGTHSPWISCSNRDLIFQTVSVHVQVH